MSLSAAELQRRHQLEGAPDPFPSLAEPSHPTHVAQSSSSQDLDTNSQVAFPSLAPASAPAAPVASSAWTSASGPRIKATVNKHPAIVDSFSLPTAEVATTGKDGKPVTLGEIMKQVMAKFKVKMEASANQKARQTTFHIRAESQKELEKAKRALLVQVSPVITLVVDAPLSTIAAIIGPKGATLKDIRDRTTAKIDVPPRQEVSTNGNGHINGFSSGKATPSLDEEDEVTVPIKVTAPQPLALEARELIKRIISEKTATASQRIRAIPPNVLPFILSRRPLFMEAAKGQELKLILTPEKEITVTGDREAVVRVVAKINDTIEAFKTSLTSLKINLPKRQHRLLVGKVVDDILAKSKCAVIVPHPDDSSEEVTVWGQGQDLPGGLAAVMEQANSQYIHEFPLPGPHSLSRQLLTYMVRIQYPKILTTAHPGVSVFTPTQTSIDKGQPLSIDIVGPKQDVDMVVRKVSELMGKLIGGTRDISIDWLVHRIIIGKSAKKVKQFHDIHNVSVYFPPDTQELSSVLLVYDPLSTTYSPSPDDKTRHLEEVQRELLKLAKDAADVKSETVTVEQRWHNAVVGEAGTTLNAIIGEDRALSIKVGVESGDPASTDKILIRGPSQDVDRAVKEILRIVENAKNDEIVNSYSTEFEIDREYVGRVVGAMGTGVNRLRDQLGVKVDVSDEVDDKELGKKKKAVSQRSKVRITGRKENVEEAKKRILTQIERLADETSEVLKIPSQYHSSLIGASGKYAIRLEEKYSVKITFPRQSAESGDTKTREQLKSDEVLVKGGKKGVAGAKAELLDALEFEKESNNILKFTVPTRTVARILGRGGAQINEIKADTDAHIDVDESPDNPAVTNITARGTKKAIAAAKTAILAIAEQVAEETNVTLSIEHKYHRALIGAGGQALRDLVQRCGGDTDPKALAGLIRFPKQGEPSDEVRLRGDPKLVAKVKTELENTVVNLKDRIILAAEIPAAQHRSLIGRNGQNLKELQSRTKAQVQFPGSRAYATIGEAENAAELHGVDEANVVKVSGSRAACEKAIEEMKASSKPAALEVFTGTISVPLKYHYAVSQQGSFFRNLRSFGVQVEHSAMPQRPAVPTEAPSADAVKSRIDEPEEGSSGIGWIVVPNYVDPEEGESTWTLKARDQPGLDRGIRLVKDAMKHAETMTSVGFLTMPDRSMFPRIVGTKGATVSRLRSDTGTDITVSRENSTIVIIGSNTAITTAKDAILNLVNSNGKSGRFQ